MQPIKRETIEAAASGDIQSFEEIYKAASGFVLNVAYRMVNTKEDAEEVTQEVFVTLYKRLNTFRFDASLKTWIYRITMNTSINFIKKRLREKEKQGQFKEKMMLEKTDDNIKEKLDRETRENYLKSLLEILNPEQRACMVLRCSKRLSYQEIADALSININTVRTRLKRAREVLMRHVKETRVVYEL